MIKYRKISLFKYCFIETIYEPDPPEREKSAKKPKKPSPGQKKKQPIKFKDRLLLKDKDFIKETGERIARRAKLSAKKEMIFKALNSE